MCRMFLTASILLHNEQTKICFDISLIIHEHNSKVKLMVQTKASHAPCKCGFF